LGILAVNDMTDGSVDSRRGDLLVKAVSVQGGESDIGGEKMAFARIVMSGVGLESSGLGAEAPRRREIAVLKLADAEQLAAGLHDVLNLMARSAPTPPAPAMGIWSWTTEPPFGDDLLVAETNANGTAIAAQGVVTPTVRVDFTGTSVQALASPNPLVQVQGAIFSGPRQVRVLISSLRKVVRSALEQRRVEVYVSAEQSLSAVRF